MVVSCPPTRHPCPYGIDFSMKGELIAAGKTDEKEIASFIGLDSLHYLSIDGLKRAMGRPDGQGFCFACFTGQYPVSVPEQLEADKLSLEIPVRAV